MTVADLERSLKQSVGGKEHDEERRLVGGRAGQGGERRSHLLQMLFSMVDSDENGLITFREWANFRVGPIQPIQHPGPLHE